MNITHAQLQGPRPYQEDRFAIIQDNGAALLSVFDGHAGADTADIAVTLLPTLYGIAKRDAKTGMELLTLLFKLLNEHTQHMASGSTASMVYIKDDCAIVGILGDSPVVIQTATRTFVSPEHNVRTNLLEREEAIKRGATFINGYIYHMTPEMNFGSMVPGLQMSRALGDAVLAPILSREPYITAIPLNGEATILVATDGVFDPAHSYAMDVAGKKLMDAIVEQKADAEMVLDYSQINLHDNATAIVARVSKGE